jgi:hypothetical protein
MRADSPAEASKIDSSSSQQSMNRRHFVTAFAATLLASRSSVAQSSQTLSASLDIQEASSIRVPQDFVGLSYESAQLANPEFFSVKNHQLIQLFHELAPHGNLRLGGGSSEFATYSDQAPVGPPPFEVFGPDTSKTVKHGTTTSALALRNLRAFLEATNWNCLYGLNFGQGSVENAAREAAAVHSILGPRLVAFQIGNEPDSFRNRYRPATYTPADYMSEWNRFREAVLHSTPQARFAGPDISNKLPYLTTFATEAPQHSDIILLTGHYYAMGPAGNPQATLENLLSPEPKLTTLKSRDLHVIAEAQSAAHLPFRMSEVNSCWNGGQAGVSDTFASALWCVGYMLTCMSRGWVGVNLHGGGDGCYTPIAGAPSTGLTRRPEFYGIRFAQHFVGATFVHSSLQNADPRIQPFVFERSGKRELAVINKSPDAFHCTLPKGKSATPVLSLHAPTVDAKDGVLLSTLHQSSRRTVGVPAYTAMVWSLA